MNPKSYHGDGRPLSQKKSIPKWETIEPKKSDPFDGRPLSQRSGAKKKRKSSPGGKLCIKKNSDSNVRNDEIKELALSLPEVVMSGRAHSTTKNGSNCAK